MSEILIVIPTHNGANFLGRTLDSVLEQTFHQWNAVVVDDGSTDTTLKIAMEYAIKDSRIKLVKQKKTGVGVARNRGAENAEADTEFLLFLDQDDLLKSNALELLLEVARANPSNPAVHGLLKFIDEKDGPLNGHHEELYHRKRYGVIDGQVVPRNESLPTTFASLVFRNFIYTPGIVLVRRQYFEEAGGFDQTVAPADDWDLWLRLAILGDISFIPTVILSWRRHPGQTSRNAALLSKKTHSVYKKLLKSNLNAHDHQMVIAGYKYALSEEREDLVKRLSELRRTRIRRHFFWLIRATQTKIQYMTKRLKELEEM